MLPFTGNPLNRHSEKRSDAAWVAEQLGSARILPLWRQQVLTKGEKLLSAAHVSQTVGDALAAADAAGIFLGLDGEVPLFALDVSAAENAPEVLKPYGEFRELRAASVFLRKKDLAILSQAKGLIEWHQRHGFCARCGAPTVIAEAGYRRDCPRCQAQHFPRTDPAVIMLASHGGDCLLARNVNWADNFYSCLAGFMEPGESIEEAAARELFEEAGIKAAKVTYFASQPWPFPAALMVGCFVECETRALTLDPSEIADAKWYSKAEARALIDGEAEGFRGPMKAAIAYHLIKTWVEG
jgi:NAD+ diphosphatase